MICTPYSALGVKQSMGSLKNFSSYEPMVIENFGLVASLRSGGDGE
jgi:hypothetical protein